MHNRVRIGVIGLSSVFLLVLLAAALYSLFGERQAGPGTAASPTIQANSSEPPREPLAELGIAPGAGQSETNATAPAAAPRAAPAPTGSPTPRH